MVRPGGLGRGLGALIPSGELNASPIGGLAEIGVSEIRPNSRQPRAAFDETSLTELAESIRELGVLQPIIVRPSDDGYELIAGERRLRAARRAGLQLIPAIIRETDDATSLAHAIVENIQREDLNPLEEATAYQQLIEEFHLTHDDLATRVGKSRATVTNFVRLLQLPPSIQRMVRDRQLKMGHARAILGCPDRGFQEKLARQVVAEELSVRAVEEAVREHVERDAAAVEPSLPSGSAGTRNTPPARSLRPPGLLELEELLSDYLETRVQVTMSQSRGRVVVEFATLEDLERIYRIMTDGSVAAT